MRCMPDNVPTWERVLQVPSAPSGVDTTAAMMALVEGTGDPGTMEVMEATTTANPKHYSIDA